MTRVLVTGGAGAIGSHVVARLLDDGAEVVVVDDLSSGRRELMPAAAMFIEGSIVDDDVLDRAFASRPTHVAHLAARFANQNSVDHPVDDLQINGLGTLMVLSHARAAGASKVLHCSSSCVYGGMATAVESMPIRPDETPYGITKALGEDYARYFARSLGLDTVIVRPFNAYGPHEFPGQYRNVIPNFFAAAMRGEPLRITGTGEETRDFTFVTDLVGGIVLALFTSTTPGDVFNLGTGRSTAIGHVADLVIELTGSTGGVQRVGSREWDRTPHRLASIDQARAVLGYEPTTSIESGMRITYEWLQRALG